MQTAGHFDGRHQGRSDRANLVATLAGGADGSPIAGGNLLPRGEAGVIQPGQVRAYCIRLGCNGDAPLLSVGSQFGTFTGELEDCDAHEPLRVSIVCPCVVFAEVASDRGGRRRVYANRVFTLEPVWEPAGETQRRELRQSWSVLLRAAHSQTVSEFIAWAIGESVRTYGDTTAYRLARSRPADLDPGSVSRYCYHGDPGSPLRVSSGPAPEIVRQGLTEALKTVRPVERTNLPSVLAGMRTAHPVLWPEADATIQRLAGGNPRAADRDTSVLVRKAQFVRDLLAQAQVLLSADDGGR